MLSCVRLLLMYGVLFSLLFNEKTSARNVSEFVGVVRNLSVELSEDEVNKDVDVYTSLKLNISWSRPEGNRQPTSYSVIVTGIPNDTKIECPQESIFYTSSNITNLSVLLPRANDFIDMSEMHILPGCSYKVQVYANPRTKPSDVSPEVIYTVPNCVAGKCHCEKANTRLPVPKVHAVRVKDNLSIHWNVSHGSEVDFYVISVGVPLLISKNGLPVYNTTKIGEVPPQRNTFLYRLETSEFNTEIKPDLKVSVIPVDTSGCFGTAGNFIISLSTPDSSSNEALWFTLTGAIMISAVLSVLGFVLLQNKIKFTLLWRSRSISRIHRIPKGKSPWADSLLQKENILYVKYNHQDENNSEMDQLEVSYKNLKLLQELGKGQFGKVYLGCLDDAEGTLVAVKTSQCINDTDEMESRRQFIEEIDIMKLAGDHPHLVRLIGYCSQPDKPICIILEYMEGGDLLRYLHSRRKIQRSRSTVTEQSTGSRTSRPSISETVYTTVSYSLSSNSGYSATNGTSTYKTVQPGRRYMNISEDPEDEKQSEIEDPYGNIGVKQFLRFALDIASGMEYLEAKGITHRDLAARNILVGPNLVLKISDFGLSRNGVYVIKTKGTKTRHLPIRWMSPEALRDRAFSSKSDVWSFAIVLWEIGTLGSFPYPSIRDDHLLRHIIHEGGRLEQPESIDTDLYKLMHDCWAEEPEDRPSFAELAMNFERMITPELFIRSASNPCYALSPQ